MGEATVVAGRPAGKMQRPTARIPQRVKNTIAVVGVFTMGMSCTLVLVAAFAGQITATPAAAVGLSVFLSLVVTLLAWGAIGEGRNLSSVIFEDPEWEKLRLETAAWGAQAFTTGVCIFAAMSALIAVLILAPVSSRLGSTLTKGEFLLLSIGIITSIILVELSAWRLWMRPAQEDLARDYEKGSPGYAEQGMRIVKAVDGYRIQYTSEEARKRSWTGLSDLDERELLLTTYIMIRGRASKDEAAKDAMKMADGRKFLLSKEDVGRIAGEIETIIQETHVAYTSAWKSSRSMSIGVGEAGKRASVAAKSIASQVSSLLGEIGEKKRKEKEKVSGQLVKRILWVAEYWHLEEELKREEGIILAKRGERKPGQP